MGVQCFWGQGRSALDSTVLVDPEALVDEEPAEGEPPEGYERPRTSAPREPERRTTSGFAMLDAPRIVAP